jgi:hypothetical protein
MVKIGNILDQIVNNRRLEKYRINVPIVDESRHSIKLVPEHIAPALPDFSDESSGKLHVRGKKGPF